MYERDQISYRSRDGQIKGPAGPPKADPEAPEYITQVLLADILDDPSREVIPRLQERYPGRDGGFYALIINGVRSNIDEVIGGLQKQVKGEPSPTLVDRYSFAWRFLKRADALIWKTKKADIPAVSRLEHAEKTFSTILPVPLQLPLLEALLRHLRLGTTAEYLHHYSAFRKAAKPLKLPNPFGNIDKNHNVDLLRILIWWCIRARKEEYVEVRPNEPVRLEFGYVVEQVIADLTNWTGTAIEHFPDLDGEVERQLNAWLSYSKIDQIDDDVNQSSDLARAFVKHNELTTKLARIGRTSESRQSDPLVAQLQAQLKQYIDENRQLEERLRSTQLTVASNPQPVADLDSMLSSFLELREVLKVVDTKYAFDTLNAVQLGEETHLTLKSFVGHLFYALRKRGFTEYPADDEFDLTYESSGLYDCDGFEVAPSRTVHVKVSRKGWAFNSRGRWLPVRRARVVAAKTQERSE